MSAALSNLGISFHTTAPRRANATTSSTNQFRYVFPIRAMAAEGRESLDHLQRANNRQPTQPKKKIAQVTPIGIWDRFPNARTVQQMMDTMDWIMEDPFHYPSIREENGGGYRRGRTPWEIKESEDVYKMRFDMPGMTKKDVEVWVEEKMLVVRAEKQGEEEGEGEWSAKSYGKYSSRIALPENVELEKIKAEVKDGVLYITLPKARISSTVFGIDVQ